MQELKNQLKSNIGAITGQTERLLQLVQSDNQENQRKVLYTIILFDFYKSELGTLFCFFVLEIQNLNDIQKSLIIDAITSAENLQIQLRIAGGLNN